MVVEVVVVEVVVVGSSVVVVEVVVGSSLVFTIVFVTAWSLPKSSALTIVSESWIT